MKRNLKKLAELAPTVWYYGIRILWLLAGGAVLVAACMAAYYLPQRPMPAPATVAPLAAGGFSTVEFVTIILTAATVILAGLAIVLALAGVFGYVQMKNSAEETAERVTKDYLRDRLPRMVEETARQTGAEPADGDDFMKAATKGGSVDNHT